MMTLSVNRIFDRWQVLQGATVFEMCPIGMVREMSVTGKCDSVSRQPFEPSQQPHTPQSDTGRHWCPWDFSWFDNPNVNGANKAQLNHSCHSIE